VHDSMRRWAGIAAPGGIVFLLSIVPWHADYEMQAANQFSNIGNEYFYAREYDQAIGFYHKALEKLDGKAKIHSNLGVTYKVTGRWPEAAHEFERALQLDPGNENAKRHLREIRQRAAENGPSRNGADP
jgi:tetratricopeptide (TPR) repeat protein